MFSPKDTTASLQYTEQHIKDNGQLPRIPSASDVKTTGISLGDMNGRLLEKIEETDPASDCYEKRKQIWPSKMQLTSRKPFQITRPYCSNVWSA
jgi:hypothetical protein